jgi:FtsH-binding integral membrane protein
MKFVVGAMASTFGIFWATEGIGAVWPQSDLVLLPLFAWVMLISLGSVLWLRQRITKHPLSSLPKPIKSSKDKGVLVRGIKVVISFILDFVVGDEYITAIAIWTVVAFSLVVHESNDASNWLTFAALFGLLLPLGTAFQVRRLS